jgi:hypothetical protein
MLSIFDTPSLERALSLPLDAKLRRLLRKRVEHLATLDFAVRDATYFVVIDRETSIDDVTDELGWSPLVNPIDGARFGTAAFHPFHDFLADRGGWFEMMVSTSNDVVVVLLVRDDERTDVNLITLCRTFAEEEA